MGTTTITITCGIDDRCNGLHEVKSPQFAVKNQLILRLLLICEREHERRSVLNMQLYLLQIVQVEIADEAPHHFYS